MTCAGRLDHQVMVTAATERRQLTVMFCDLVGFTPLAEQLDPEDLREVVRAYQQASAAVIARYSGYIAQYQGDGLLVYFGFPQAHEDDAQRAVRTGLEIVEAMPALNAHLTLPDGVRVTTRIGIHTGRVVAGTVGGGIRTAQLAVGATPNVATRIHGLATPDTVLMSATTLHLVQGYFVCEDLGTHTLKGVAHPMPVAQVLVPTTAQSRLEAVGTTRLSAMVGRDTELAVCVDRWQQSTAGRGQVVVLRGEAAIGKSRLVEALHTHIHSEAGARMGFAVCRTTRTVPSLQLLRTLSAACSSRPTSPLRPKSPSWNSGSPCIAFRSLKRSL